MCSRRPDLRFAIVCLLVIACLAGSQAGDAMSDPAPPVAGVVIDYGNGAQTLALVPLLDADMSGIDLLQATELDILTLGSGGWGVAVCAIEQVGCDLSSCRARLCQTSDPTSPYWQYLQAPDEAGAAWRFSNRGASATTIEAGDVDAWFWLGTRPAAPSVTVADIANRLEVDLASLGSEPVIRTFGALPEDAANTPSMLVVLASGVVVLATATVGLVAIRRSRAVAP